MFSFPARHRAPLRVALWVLLLASPTSLGLAQDQDEGIISEIAAKEVDGQTRTSKLACKGGIGKAGQFKQTLSLVQTYRIL